MKATVFYGAHNLKLEQIPVPKISKDQVLIRVHACGVCGTDMHIFDGDEGAAQTPSGTVLGHEFAGEVVEVGDNVTGVQVGDRVCVDPNQLCGKCDFCRSGVGHFCENMIGIGTTVHGGFAEYCAVPQSQVYPFPQSLSYEQAAMAEPVACCLHGIEMCNIQCSNTVLIIGGGMIGLIMLQLARLKGASTIILSEPVVEKRAHAKALGADICIDPINEDIHAVLERNGINQIHTVIECAGRTSTIEQAIELAGKKATVMMFGLTSPNATITVKPFEVFKKELIITASYINPYTQRRALNLISSGQVDVSSMIYKRIPLEDLPGMLADVKGRGEGKHIVVME